MNYGHTTIPLITPDDISAVENEAQHATLTWLECEHLNRGIERQRRWQHADYISELRTEGHVKQKHL